MVACKRILLADYRFVNLNIDLLGWNNFNQNCQMGFFKKKQSAWFQKLTLQESY